MGSSTAGHRRQTVHPRASDSWRCCPENTFRESSGLPGDLQVCPKKKIKHMLSCYSWGPALVYDLLNERGKRLQSKKMVAFLVAIFNNKNRTEDFVEETNIQKQSPGNTLANGSGLRYFIASERNRHYEATSPSIKDPNLETNSCVVKAK